MSEFFFDSEAEPAWNMAVDEALLRCCREPVLRFYGWDKPAMSIGYFQSYEIVPSDIPFVRRYTGGGLVDHAHDVTYSVMAPRGHVFYEMGTQYCYQKIHEAVAKGLVEAGMTGVELSTTASREVSAACFEKPVQHDVLCQGKKVAGAAQRRTKQGCLHQGSLLVSGVKLDELREILSLPLIAELGNTSGGSKLTNQELTLAYQLESTRYSTREWNEAR